MGAIEGVSAPLTTLTLNPALPVPLKNSGAEYAEVLVLHHATTLCAGYTPTVHVGVVSQAAQVLAIAGLDGAPLASLRTADRAVLHCRFAHKPELIREGDTLLFREGRAKGVGRIRAVESPHRLPGKGGP